MSTNTQLLLAADVGGTKTILALFRPEDGPRRPLAKRTYQSARYPTLEALVAEFLKGEDWRVAHASFGIPGPVFAGRAHVTNLPWLVDEAALSQGLGFPVRLLNDLQAIAYAVPLLHAADLTTLHPGSASPEAPIAVIAPGTGLGEAFLTWDGSRYRPHPSEGGHADFAPGTPLELELLDYLWPRLNHVSYERVCSGIGLPNLYAFLKDSGHCPEPAWLREQLATAPDATRLIVQMGMAGKADICTRTLEMFALILAAEAGNMALRLLATGGVYLSGGLPARILPFLQTPTFVETFTSKGRFADLLTRIPVHVIENPEVALFGAASHGLQAVPGDSLGD